MSTMVTFYTLNRGISGLGLMLVNYDFNLEFDLINWNWNILQFLIKGLIFGLLLTVTGLAGLLSAVRRSYSLLFTFFLFCMLSFLESIFLIIYYSILINYYYRYNTSLQPGAEIWRSSNRPDSGDRSFGLVGTNLALSIVALLLSFATMIYAALAGRICTQRKTFANFYGQLKYTAHPPATLPILQ